MALSKEVLLWEVPTLYGFDWENLVLWISHVTYGSHHYQRWSTRGTAGCIIIGGTVCSVYFSNYFRNISCTSLCCKKSQSVCGFVALSSCVLIFAMIFGHDTIHHQQNTEKIQLELNQLTQKGWDGWGREPDNHSRLIFTLFLQPVANWDRNLLNRALTTSV